MNELIVGIPLGYDAYVLKVFHLSEKDGHKVARVESYGFDDAHGLEMYCLTHGYMNDPERDRRVDDGVFVATVWVDEAGDCG